MTEKQKELQDFLSKVRPFMRINEYDYIKVSLQILEAAAKMHPKYTLEELHDYVFYQEVPKRVITPERKNHELWDTVLEKIKLQGIESSEFYQLLIDAFDRKNNV